MESYEVERKSHTYSNYDKEASVSATDKIKNLLRPGHTLAQRVARGGMWVFATQAVSEGFRFARTVVLARVLAPDDFGLMGVALLTMSAIELFTTTGFSQALIQKKGDIREYLDTAWTLSGLRGLVLCGLLFAVAPLVSSFFSEPAARPIIQVVALSLLVQGWGNIALIYFQRDLDFRKRFAYQIGGAMAHLVVSISAVLILRSVWALVFGLLAGEVTHFALSYLLHPYRPHPRFNMAKARELFGFGRWIMASKVLLYLLYDGDDIVVGKLLSAAALGLYQLAFRIASLPTTQVTHIISQLMFPTYAKLQDNPPKLREAYLKTLQITAFITIPIAGGILVLAPDFTRLFLGEKWMAMVPAMQLLALFGAIRAFGASHDPLFRGTGNPHIETKLAVLRLLMQAALIYPLIMTWDILGASMAVTIPLFATQLVATFRVIKLIGIRASDVIRLLGVPTLCTLGFILSLWFIRPFFDSIPGFIGLTVIGALLYLATMYVADSVFDLNYRRILRELWGHIWVE